MLRIQNCPNNSISIQGSPNYGLRAKCGPRSYFVNDEKIIYLRKICWFVDI